MQLINLQNANVFTNTPMSNNTYLGRYGSIYVPSQMVSSYKAANNWSIYSDRITALPSSYDEEYIYGLEYYMHYNLSEIPSSKLNVINVGVSAFYSCSNLGQVSLSQVKVVSPSAFYSCRNLTTVNLPNCEYIGKSAFYSCPSLSDLSIPNCIVVEASAFYSCRSLGTVNLPNCECIRNYAFAFCGSISYISLPKCKNIGYGAFSGCNLNISSMYLPTCRYIEGSAFFNAYFRGDLYLLDSYMTVLENSNAFVHGGITYLNSIYVRASLVSDYQTDNIWRYFSNKFVGLTDEQIAQL